MFKWTLLVNMINKTPLEGTIRATYIKKTSCSYKVEKQKLFWASRVPEVKVLFVFCTDNVG